MPSQYSGTDPQARAAMMNTEWAADAKKYWWAWDRPGSLIRMYQCERCGWQEKRHAPYPALADWICRPDTAERILRHVLHDT
jgi:hypothetical protein